MATEFAYICNYDGLNLEDECTEMKAEGLDYCESHAHLQKRDETNPKDLIGATKPRLSLVPPSGLVYAALAMANGADKYGAYNWREKKVQTMIYLEACMRHLLAYQDGEDNAKDSGVPHLGHAIACLLILIDAKESDMIIDNRPKAGAMAALVERYTKKA